MTGTQAIAQLPLPLEVYTVHCFFARRCKHIVRAEDPYKAGALMEEHYTKKHQEQIDRICKMMSGTQREK